MVEALYSKWKSKNVTGEEKAIKPNMIGFNNTINALQLLNKHINNNSRIAVHCDVDVDGIGSGYEVKRFLECQTSVKPIYVINKEKIHGIQQKHVDYFNTNTVDLLIILDSSSNDIQFIKQFNCDVLVIDHHEMEHTDLYGITNDNSHTYIIVNNMIDNINNNDINVWLKGKNSETNVKIESYNVDSRMSCGVVVYELLRVYCEAYRLGSLIENMMLYQWAGVTLITDAIPLLSDRNQWYMDNTVHSMNTESCLLTIIQSLNRYAVCLSKSVIGYTLAPTINRAIRAGASGEAMDIVLNCPSRVCELQKYRELQDWSVSEGIINTSVNSSFVTKDINDTGINKNYCGVIAGRLCDEYKRNSAVYTVNNGIAEGSFRGRTRDSDYKKCFKDFGVFAQGHKGSFGFKVPVETLPEIMDRLTTVETDIDNRYYLTAGKMPESLLGVYHIADIEGFKKAGGLMMLGIGNSKVSSDEQIMITVPSFEAKLLDVKGKLYLYDVLGFTCKGFNEIDSSVINIYVECSKGLEFYIK